MEAVSLNDYGYASNKLALLYVYEKRYDKAKQIAPNSVQKSPNNAELWYALALADYKLGNFALAKQESAKAYQLEQSPLLYKVYYRLNNNLPINL